MIKHGRLFSIGDEIVIPNSQYAEREKITRYITKVIGCVGEYKGDYLYQVQIKFNNCIYNMYESELKQYNPMLIELE